MTKNKNRAIHTDKLFSPWTLGLCIAGLLINVIFANLMHFFKIPLFLDNIGSILIAVLGGPIPGIAIGFLSNALNSASDPISLYYGILSVLIALTANLFSSKGYLKTIRGCISASLIFAFIGGAVGSCMTWMLYGGGIGQGISSPYAHMLLDRGLPIFWAQFIADVIIDIFDKLFTMLPIYLFLKFYPKALYNKFPLSYVYDRNEDAAAKYKIEQKSFCRKTSVQTRITLLIVISSILLSSTATLIGIYNYTKSLTEQYQYTVSSTAKLTAAHIDGDKIDDYISQNRNSEEYIEIEKHLYTIMNDVPDLTYLYVYKILPDGCHVVFDLNTPYVQGSPPGDVLPFDKSFLHYRDSLIAGEGIDSVISNDTYGWLMSSYFPIKNSSGETTAFACADVSMEKYIDGMLIYIIRLFSVLFGITMLVVAFSLWYANKRIVSPINDIVQISRDFSNADTPTWLSNPKWLEKNPVNTGDEIEGLYNTVCEVQENIVNNVIKLRETEMQLRQSAELERKNKELASAVKMADEANAAKTNFLSRMSHDMRTPMNGILGLVSLSKDESDLSVLHENIEKIGRSGNYLLSLINDTLDMNKIESKKMTINREIISTKDFFENLFEMINSTAHKKKIDFRIINKNIEMNTYVKADPIRINQIFVNLLSNAVKFTPEGGSVVFTMERLYMENNIIHDKFVISDTGVGMSENFIKNNLFKPFSQEYNQMTTMYAGSGLGLAIVKSIITLMGGSIEVKSEPCSGSEFTIYLNTEYIPQAEAEKNILTSSSNKNAILSELAGKKVLLCEDHPLNTEIATKLLQNRKIEVYHAANGQIAVDKFTSSPIGYYDAVLMDIRMPVMDGLSAAKAIRLLDREDAKSTPIIAMTANAFDDDRKQTHLAGMNAHIAKPINPQLLFNTIHKCMKESGKI